MACDRNTGYRSSVPDLSRGFNNWLVHVLTNRLSHNWTRDAHSFALLLSPLTFAFWFRFPRPSFLHPAYSLYENFRALFTNIRARYIFFCHDKKSRVQILLDLIFYEDKSFFFNLIIFIKAFSLHCYKNSLVINITIILLKVGKKGLKRCQSKISFLK